MCRRICSSHQLVAEVEKIKVEAKRTISKAAKRAAAIWSENSDVTRLKQIETELSEMFGMRAMIDHEVRRAIATSSI